MKRIFSIICIFIIVSTALVGCEIFLGKEATIKKLEKNGFLVTRIEYDEELASVNDKINKEIRFSGGNFTVELKDKVYLHLINDEAGADCTIYEFATSEQAEKYVLNYLESRSKLNKYKIGYSDKIVVVTDSEKAQGLIGLEFK